MIKTKNFTPEGDPKLLCTCGHPDCDKRSVDQEILNRIQLIREHLGLSMTVTSGGRCPNHPDELSKSRPGDHQKCKAVDIECDCPLLETKLKVLAGTYGFNSVAGGAEDGFVHIAQREGKRIRTWGY